MMHRIESVPELVLEHITYLLEPTDLFHLSLVSKKFNQVFTSNNLWKSKTVFDFGNLFELYTLFTTSTGIQLDDGLTEKFSIEPTNWRQYYITKNKAINGSDDTALMDEADKEYETAKEHLKSFQEDGNIQVLIQVSSKMLWILDVFPGHAGCYYILAFICFVLNKLEEATIILQMGRAVDPTFEPLDVMELEIKRIAEGYKGEEELLKDDQLSPAIVEVLEEIFKKFDVDNDGALNSKELNNFIFKTNGSHPPPAFLRQIGLRFGANAKGWLTKDGFLAFYLEQTLDDPSETRNDMGVHGYDPQTLKLKMEE